MGARFCYCTNNGVTALMPVGWYSRIYEEHQFWTDDMVDWDTAVKEGLRIFTFCDARRLMRNPREMRYFTGTREDITPLLEGLGSDSSGLFPKSFHVPFSNGFGVMRNEHKFAVSHGDLIEWFGPNAGSSVL